MSAGRELMRVSDAERQVAVDRLRSAHDEGRLDLHEYDDRLVRAYGAVTYADLDQLFADLPPAAHRPPVAPGPAAVRPQTVAWTGFLPLPLPLKILWTIWAAAVVINLTVWLLVSLSTGEPEYFWPMWLAVPGVALTGVSIGVRALLDGRFTPPPDDPGPRTR